MDIKSDIQNLNSQKDAENICKDTKTSQVQWFLGNHKSFIVFVWNILMWREEYYAGVVFLCISAVFITLSFVNLSLVTFVALCISGVLFLQMLVDALPNQTERKNLNEDFVVVCDNIDQTILRCKLSFMDLHELKQTNPVAFYTSTIGTGLFVAWLGTWISTFLFLYVSVLVIFALPGLIHTGKLIPIDGKI